MSFKLLFNTLCFICNHPLNKNNRFSALNRWLKWQVASRLAPGAVAVNFVDDVQLLTERGMTGATGNIYTGLHEFEDMAFVMHFLRPGDLFIDVGANVGSYTLLAGGVVGAECIAVEPLPATYRHLQRNISLNNLGNNVTLLNVAVGREDGNISFTSGLDTENHVVSDAECGAIETITVAVTTLDKIVGDNKPRLMKIDVEGFESNVIASAEHTLSSPYLNAVLLELNGLGKRYGFDETLIHKKMLGFGFSPYTYSPFKRSLAPTSEMNPHGNTLYIRDIDAVTKRVATAPMFHVLNQSI
jgi:FkbM family methyltransferase